MLNYCLGISVAEALFGNGISLIRIARKTPGTNSFDASEVVRLSDSPLSKAHGIIHHAPVITDVRTIVPHD